jgi:Mitochondrial K+-H+ exchange-related
MSRLLEIMLLDAAAGRVLFYADPPADDGDPNPSEEIPRGLRQRIAAKWKTWKTRLRQSQGLAARWCRAVWEWLHARTHPDEPLLARLHNAETIELSHPSGWSESEVQAGWLAFLNASRRRHWPWFVVNCLVAPFTILLGPLPGPNLIGYWIAYRAIHHGFILHGLRKARHGRIALRLRADPRLDAERAEPPVRLAALGCEPVAVREFLRRHRIEPFADGVTEAA